MFQRPRHPPRPRFSEPPVAERVGVHTLLDACRKIWGVLWLPGLIFIVPLLCYWPVLGQGFVSDDISYYPLYTFTVRDYLRSAAMIHGGLMEFPFFRPVTFATFRLDYLLWGTDPVGFHLSNLIGHSLNCVLLFYLARVLGLGRFAAASAALFFGLYPSHPEAVTWISGRFDIQALGLLLISLLLWCGGRLRNDDRLVAVSALAFLAAILAKEVAAAGLLLLPLVDWLLHLRTRREWGHGVPMHWRWYIVFFAIVVCVVAFRIWLYGDVGGYLDEQFAPTYVGKDFTTMMRNLVSGDLWMLITPLNRDLWPEWSGAWRLGFIIAGVVAAAALLAGIARAIILARRSDEIPLALTVSSVLWVLVMLLPVIAVMPVDGDLQFSRFLYAPAAGLALWVGVAVSIGMAGRPHWKRLTVVLAMLLLLMSGAALRRNNIAWLEAGEIGTRMHALMVAHTADLPDGATILVVNPPWLWKGAQCAPHNHENWLYFMYGTRYVRTLFLNKDPDDLDEWWEGLRHNWRRPGVGFEWVESERMLRVLPPIELPEGENGIRSVAPPDLPPTTAEEVPGNATEE